MLNVCVCDEKGMFALTRCRGLRALQKGPEFNLLEFGARELEVHAEKLFALTSLTIPNASRDFPALKR